MILNKEKKSKKAIKFRQTLFWDVDPKKIDPDKHAKYIIYYPRELIRDRIINSRGVLSPMSKNFWTIILEHI